MLIGPIAADRRADLRHKVAGEAEVTDGNSGVGMLTRISDLSKRGCFLETSTPFPVNTITKIFIRKGTESFEADAKVVSAFSNTGMGLQFTNVDPVQRHILSAWLGASIETSWQSSNRRRSQRILVRLPVRVSGVNSIGSPFEEETHTQTISAHGASLLLSAKVEKGQRLVLSNAPSRATVECLVAYVGESQGELVHVAVTFVWSNQYQLLWNANFPLPDPSKGRKDAAGC
jgi:hypothetical protein